MTPVVLGTTGTILDQTKPLNLIVTVRNLSPSSIQRLIRQYQSANLKLDPIIFQIIYCDA